MKTYTAQEVFNISRDFILAQGEPAYTSANGCAYTVVKPDGKEIHCAAYPFLSEEGKRSAPNRAWQQVPGFDKEEALQLEHSSLIASLQMAHDGAAAYVERALETGVTRSFVEEYKERLQRVAARFNLEAGV